MKTNRKQLPHIEIEGSFYHLVFRLKSGNLTDDEIRSVLHHIRDGHEKFYRLIAAQVMPDHVHLILQPNAGFLLERVVKGIKIATARIVNKKRKQTGSVWAAGYFDRIIRSPKDLDEKINYIFENPLRAKIVEDGWTYIGWYFIEM